LLQFAELAEVVKVQAYNRHVKTKQVQPRQEKAYSTGREGRNGTRRGYEHKRLLLV